MSRGKFITLEGGEGAGKSTQARRLMQRLQDAGQKAIVTREPGGSKLAETIREFLLTGEAERFGPFAEAILFSIAREAHLESTIRPALTRGDWVVCDRFADSTRAYQGTAGVKPGALNALEQLVVAGTKPNLTIVLDLPAEAGLARAAKRSRGNGHGSPPDHFELRELSFHAALRRAFLDIAEGDPERCAVVDARLSETEVADKVWDLVVGRLRP